VARLRYIGEYVFGGNISAYSRATGFSRYGVQRILAGLHRVRIATLSRLAIARIVNAEWLLCGTGPMLKSDIVIDSIAGIILPTNGQSKYPVFDTNLSKQITLKRTNYTTHGVTPHGASTTLSKFSGITACISVAHQIFTARKNQTPVVLFLSVDVIVAGIHAVIRELLKKQYVTGIALTFAAAEQEYIAAGYRDFGPLLAAIRRGAQEGIGLGEAMGRYIFPKHRRRKSIIAACCDLNIPISVHGGIGESVSHYMPADTTTNFGSVIGATLYTDTLILAEQLLQMAGSKPGLIVHTGEAQPGLTTLAPMVRVLAQARDIQFNELHVVRLLSPPLTRTTDTFIYAPYRDTFPALLLACKTVYTGGCINDPIRDGGEHFESFRCFEHSPKRIRRKSEPGG